jgi:outer membrane protein assembly factor BamB
MKTLIIFIFISLNTFPQQQTDIPWPTLADSPWPMIKHDPQFTGRSPYKGPQTPTVIWTVDMPHGIFDGPIIGEDTHLYFGPYAADITPPYSGISAYFYCYDNNGNFLWEYNLPSLQTPSGGPLIDSAGCIYFGALDHYFYALNPDGTLKWRYQTGELIGDLPNIDLQGNLYVASYDGYLYCLTREGMLNWKVNHQAFAGKSPTFSPDGNTIYIPGADSNIYALNLDGSIKWVFNCSRVYKGVLVDSEGNIYFVPEQAPQYFYSIRNDGTVRWKVLIQNLSALEIISIPTIDWEGNLYTIGADSLPPYHRALISYDYFGNFRWIYRLDNEYEDIYQPLICDSDGTIYFGSTFGYKYYAVANDGTLKWEMPLEFDKKQVDNTGAISEDGTLYIGVHATIFETGLTRTLYAIKDNGSVDVNDHQLSSTQYALEQNYPNPFNPSTVISYSLPQNSEVTIKIYDVLGNEITTLIDEEKPAGNYELKWNAPDIAGGVYFYQMSAVPSDPENKPFIETRKMILLR